MIENDKQLLFEILQAKYMLMHDKKDLFEAFDNNWFSCNDIDVKIEILAEAIKNNIKVSNTKSYLKIIEKVIM